MKFNYKNQNKLIRKSIYKEKTQGEKTENILFILKTENKSSQGLIQLTIKVRKAYFNWQMQILLGYIFSSGFELGTLQFFVWASDCHFLKKKKKKWKEKIQFLFLPLLDI
jgi:methionine salvage enolase-phosphatase E1